MDIREIEKQVQKLRAGSLSKEMIRKLPTEIGRRYWKPGIPLLLELGASPDSIVRYNVVMSLAYKFEYREAKSFLAHILEKDPDDDCREAAAAGMGFLFRRSHDCSMIFLLSKVARSDPERYVRDSAFSALLWVSGRAEEEKILVHRPQIDQALIDQILSECF